MSAVVLASHLPGAGRFRSDRHHVVGIPCVDDLAYCRGWRFFWESGRPIVNVEHDMQCSDELIDGLLACPEPFCTYAYRLHHIRGQYAQALSKPHSEDWVAEGTEWCAFSGIGFCKIDPEARARPLPETPWPIVDCAVSRATDCRVHVHWPEIDHHHH